MQFMGAWHSRLSHSTFVQISPGYERLMMARWPTLAVLWSHLERGLEGKRAFVGEGRSELEEEDDSTGEEVEAEARDVEEFSLESKEDSIGGVDEVIAAQEDEGEEESEEETEEGKDESGSDAEGTEAEWEEASDEEESEEESEEGEDGEGDAEDLGSDLYPPLEASICLETHL